MGQTCANVQSVTFDKDRNSISRNLAAIQSELNKQITHQKSKIKKISYIQNSNQLVYQFNKTSFQEKVEHRLVNKWTDIYSQFELIQLIQRIDERSFITKIKSKTDNKTYWKVLSIISVDNLDNSEFYDFGLFYYNFSKLSDIRQITNNFLFAENCFINIPEENKSRVCFIIESQKFQNQIVPLKVLGQFMKANDICWQDKQFRFILQSCFHKLQMLHKNLLFKFEDFLIDKNGDCFGIGGLAGQSVSMNQQKIVRDIHFFTIYFIQTLFGIEIKQVAKDKIIGIIQSEELQCKFKHPQSTNILKNLLEFQQQKELFNYQPNAKLEVNNITHYVTSYCIKRILPENQNFAEAYIGLSDYQTGKQLLFEKFAVLIYGKEANFQKNTINKWSSLFKNEQNRKRVTFHQKSQKLKILQRILEIEKIISTYSINNQLDEIALEYQSLCINLASNLRKGGNYLESVNLLQKCFQLLNEEHQSWYYLLHLAETYFLIGDLNNAQKYFKESIKLEINEVNFCRIIKFYTAVLNWQKAISLIKSYQQLVNDEFIYDLLISKCLLSKALCVSSIIKQKQNERSSILYEGMKIIKRVLQRKNTPKIILIDAYEVLGDFQFYLAEYNQARESYEKSLVILVSFTAQSGNKIDSQQPYVPSYIKADQQKLIKSLASNNYKTLPNESSNKKQNAIFSNVDTLLSNAAKRHSIITQEELFFNACKKSVLLASIANTYYMQQKYSKSIQIYQEARTNLGSKNEDLRNSIMGNMAICLIQMGKKNKDNTKLKQGKEMLEHILSVTQQSNPKKIEQDVNYLFLKQSLSS